MPARIEPEDKVFPTPRFKSLAILDRYRKLCLWLPVSIISKAVPWGYKVDPSNPKAALPDEKALACYIKANEYLRTNSYQVVAEWLGSCGFPISDDGLRNMLRDRPFWPESKLTYEERLKL